MNATTLAALDVLRPPLPLAATARAPWLVSRYKLVNLMAIVEFSASTYWTVASLIGQMISRLNQPGPLSGEQWEKMGETIGQLQSQLVLLGMSSPIAQIQRLDQYVDGSPTNDKTRALLTDLQYRIVDDLGDHFFLSITKEHVGHYQQSVPLFGAIVETVFPQMSEDISEAGKCLALGRSTAAVFHLMRVMELAVQAFGTKLGVSLVGEKYWHSILEQVDKAIKGMDQRAPETKGYAGISAHLYNVKLAWRNEVMHPKQTYTEDEAEKVFNATKAFVGELAAVLK
jgi:hypothetical protein